MMFSAIFEVCKNILCLYSVSCGVCEVCGVCVECVGGVCGVCGVCFVLYIYKFE